MDNLNQPSQTSSSQNYPLFFGQRMRTIVIVSILFGLLFLGILILSLRYSQPQTVPQRFPSPVVPTGSAATENWKIYTSTKFGMSFKYPPNYPYPKEAFRYLFVRSPNTSGGAGLVKLKSDQLQFDLSIESCEPNESLDRLVQDIRKVGLTINLLAVPIHPEEIKERDITIDGTRAIRWQWKWDNNGGESIFIVNKKKCIQLNKFPLQTTRQKEFDQILSTFRFLE